jgi:hypothetical protein
MPLDDLLRLEPLAAARQGDYLLYVLPGVDEQNDEGKRQRVGTYVYANVHTGELRKGGYWMDWPEDESLESWLAYVKLPMRKRAEMELGEQLEWGLAQGFEDADEVIVPPHIHTRRNSYDAHAAGWRWSGKWVIYSPTGRVLGTVYGRDILTARTNLRPHVCKLGLATAQEAHLRPWPSATPEERAAADPRYGGVEIGIEQGVER